MQIISMLSGILVSLVALIIPSIVIWRSAKNASGIFWGRLAKYYVAFFAILMLSDMLPEYEFDENTAELKFDAPEFFRQHTGIDIPKGARIAHVAYERPAVMEALSD